MASEFDRWLEEDGGTTQQTVPAPTAPEEFDQWLNTPGVDAAPSAVLSTADAGPDFDAWLESPDPGPMPSQQMRLFRSKLEADRPLPTGIMGLAGREMKERIRQPIVAAAASAQSVPMAAGAALHMVGEEWANPQFYADIAKGLRAVRAPGANLWFLTQKVAEGVGKIIPPNQTKRKQNILSFAGQAAYDHYKAMQEELAAQVPTSIAKPEPANPQWWVNSMADAGTSMFATLALGGGNPAAAALIGSMMEAGPFYEDLKKDKDRHAGAKAMAFGAVVAGLEKIGFDQLFKKVKPGIVTQAIQKAIAGATEAATEIAEEPVGTFIKVLDKQGMKLTDKGKAVLDSVKQAWGVGLPTFVLGLLGGGGAAQQKAQPPPIPRQAAQPPPIPRQAAQPPPIPQAAQAAQEPGLMLPPEPGPGEYVRPAEGPPQVLEMPPEAPISPPEARIPPPATEQSVAVQSEAFPAPPAVEPMPVATRPVTKAKRWSNGSVAATALMDNPDLPLDKVSDKVLAETEFVLASFQLKVDDSDPLMAQSDRARGRVEAERARRRAAEQPAPVPAPKGEKRTPIEQAQAAVEAVPPKREIEREGVPQGKAALKSELSSLLRKQRTDTSDAREGILREALNRELLSEVDPTFKDMPYGADTTFEAVRASGAMMTMPKPGNVGGGALVLSPSTRTKGEWQVTVFASDGTLGKAAPFRHIEFESKAGALAYMKNAHDAEVAYAQSSRPQSPQSLGPDGTRAGMEPQRTLLQEVSDLVAKAGTMAEKQAVLDEWKRTHPREVEAIEGGIPFDPVPSAMPGRSRLTPTQRDDISSTSVFVGREGVSMLEILDRGAIEPSVSTLDKAGEKVVSLSRNKHVAATYGDFVFEVRNNDIATRDAPQGVVQGESFEGFEVRSNAPVPLSKISKVHVLLGRDGLDSPIKEVRRIDRFGNTRAEQVATYGDVVDKLRDVGVSVELHDLYRPSPLTLGPDGTLAGSKESAVAATATPQGAAGRPAEPTATMPGQKAPELKAAPPSPAEPVSKAKQYSIDKAMDASDTITTQDSKRKKGDARKKEVESAYLSLKTHASKLGINVENVGTYYMIDEYKRIANNVKMEIAKQYGAFPSTKSKAAKAAVDKADAERAKQRTDKQPTAKKVMGEASRFYIEKPEGVRDLAGDVYSAHNRYRRTSRGEDIQARTSAELMLADLGVPKEQILRWREEEPTMSEVQLRQKFGIEMPDWMKSWIESEPEAEPDYESKTKVWLYAEAKKRGLPVTPKMTKRELVVRLLEKATPQAPAPVPKGEKVAEEPITPGGYRKRGLASALKMRQEEPQGSLANYETREQAEWLGRRTVPADGNLTLYRATPTGEAIGPGDYVTNDQDYAQEHIRANLGGEGKITQIEATLDDIYPADGPKEFWYVPKSLTREAVAPAKSVADARAEPEADAAKPEAKPLTVAAALAAGKPVKPPKGATFVRMTDSKGNTAVVAIADMDTLKGVDIADVKFGVWGKKGFTPMNEKGTVAAATAPEDIAAEAEKARKGGFVAVPADASGPRRVYANLAAWLGRQGRTGGLGETLFQQFLGQRATASANRLRANIVRDELRRTRKELNRKFLPASVSVALDAVERGEMTVADFSTRFGLKPDSAYVKTLQNALDLRSTQRERLSKLEKESSLDRAELLAQNEAYLHTMYRVHLDPYYRPSSEAVKAANAHLLQQFTGQVDNLAKRASAAFRTTNVDVAEYLRTGDETLLEGLAPKNPKVVGAKWKERKLAQLHSMRQTADKMDRFIDEMAVGEDEITIEKNQVALNDAASSLVNELIEEQKRGYEPGGSAEGASATGALKQRTLDDPIIKKLFGEITDPVERLGTSLQIQGELIALRTLENRIHQEGKNKWWTEERSDATGTTKQLPNNVAMGPLAGKWVSPAIANQLAPKLPNKALRIYYRIMGTQRIAQLMTVGSFARDFTSNIGYALAADPVESPTYLRNFAAALRLQTRLALGKTDAREKVVDYIRKGVWDARGSGQLGDVEALLRTDVSSKVQQAWEKLANIRSQPDFAWKIASYETALKKTGNHKQALEHVRKFFQYYDENPKFVQWAAKIPVVEDYPNFWIGSTRIIANQLENVYNEAKKGNPIPLARFVAGHALCIQLTALMTSWLRKLRERIMEPVIEKATGNKVVIDDAEKNTALRTLLPGFWKNAPSVSWTETKADGTKQKRYMVLQNMTAYPTDELLTGVLQRSDLSLGDKAGEFVAQIARDRLGWNMMFSTGYEAMTGEPPEATYQQKGIMDLGHADPDTGKVIAKAAGTVLGQMLGGQTYRRGRAVLRGTMTPGAAVASWLGVPRVYTVNDELAQKMLRGTLNKYRTSLDAYARRIRENTRKDEDTTENEAGQARVLAQMGREVNAFRTWAGDIVSEADITEIVKSMRFDVKQDLKYQEILGRVVPAPKRTRRR